MATLCNTANPVYDTMIAAAAQEARLQLQIMRKAATVLLKDRKLLSLYLFYTVYFLGQGLSTYAPKFYGEIGLTDSQIGLIGAVPAFVALFVQPIWGSLSDRAKYKRNVSAGALTIAGLFCFLVQPAASRFLPLLAVLTLVNTFMLPALPVGNAIAIEYTREHGRDFGPVRMMGTVGYQVSILITGMIFAASLNGLYNAFGLLLIASAGCALLLPPVQGHQHGKDPISFTVFFKNRTLLLLFALVFLAQMSSQFYLSFFSKHLGDLGISNTLTGVITMLSVSLEVPFLLFGDRLMKRMSIWKWMWIGLIINGLRFVLLSIVRTPALIVLSQIPSVALLACFEFFPAIYLNRAVDKELRGTVQNTYTLIAFGASRIVGALLGGFIADAAGIPTVFAINGTLLLSAAVVFFLPLRRHARLDEERGLI